MIGQGGRRAPYRFDRQGKPYPTEEEPDPIRQEILKALVDLSELMPDVRLGQLIADLSYLAVGPTNEAIWDMEDHELLGAIRQHIEDLSHARSSVA